MANPIHFEGVNKVLTAPEGCTEPVREMPVFTNGTTCISCWKFSAEELAEIAATGQVWVSVMSGGTQPPIFVGNYGNTRDVNENLGVW